MTLPSNIEYVIHKFGATRHIIVERTVDDWVKTECGKVYSPAVVVPNRPTNATNCNQCIECRAKRLNKKVWVTPAISIVGKHSLLMQQVTKDLLIQIELAKWQAFTGKPKT